MERKGIRISDVKDNFLVPALSDILEEVTNGESFYWSILFLIGTPCPEEGLFLTEFSEKVNKSQNGVIISWEELNKLSDKFFQVWETLILGCRDVNLLIRYETDEEMYITCDIVIELIDRTFWQVYSKDQNLISRLEKKFQKIKFLEV